MIKFGATKEDKITCDIYGNIFHLLGFKENNRGLCDKLTEQCLKEIIKYSKIDCEKSLKSFQNHINSKLS
jgi:hypothetical protein